MKIEKDFFRTVDRNLYDVAVDEEEEHVYFDLKNDMLAKYGIDLMKEQYEKYINPKNLDEVIQYYKNINSKKENERLEIINTENCPYLYKFELGWYGGFNAVSFFNLKVNASITEFVSYHSSYKNFMEEQGEFLKYTRNLLLNSTDNPLKTALTIAI